MKLYVRKFKDGYYAVTTESITERIIELHPADRVQFATFTDSEKIARNIYAGETSSMDLYVRFAKSHGSKILKFGYTQLPTFSSEDKAEEFMKAIEAKIVLNELSGN